MKVVVKIKFLKKIVSKLTYFDAALIVLTAILGIIFFLFFYRKATYIPIRVKVTDLEVLYSNTLPKSWYANQFAVGDVELDSLGRKITEVTNVDRFAVSADRQAVYVDLLVKSVYDTRTKMYSVKGKPVAFGTPLKFNLSGVTFQGIVTDFPRANDDQKVKVEYRTVGAIGRFVEPFIVDNLTQGKKIYDANGNLLAEIVGIEVSPAEQVAQTYLGELLLKSNPREKDVHLTVKVRAKEFQNQWFVFDDMPLKVGEPLPLNFSDVSFFPTITDLE